MKVKSEEAEPPEETHAELIQAVCTKLSAVWFHVKPDEASVLHTIERLARILQGLLTVNELPEILGLDFTPSHVRELPEPDPEEEEQSEIV